MTRSELVLLMARNNPELSVHDVERIVNLVFEEISAAMIKRGRVEIRGFGSFATRNRHSRAGRNPRTGEAVQVPAKTVPYFRAGKLLNVRLNSGD